MEEAKSNICVVNLGLRRALSTTGRVIHGPGGSLRWSTSTTTCLASAGADEKATPVSSISAGGEDKSREWTSAGGEDKSRECRCTRLLRRPAGERHRPLGKLLGREKRRRCAMEGGDSIGTLELGGLAKPGSVETADSCVSAEPG